jgi:uncharacterized HAD superfamily protein
LKLGIDIDGCLNDFQSIIAEMIKKEYGIEPDKRIYYIVDELNLSSEEAKRFWDKCHPESLKIMQATEGAKESLNKLKDLGCELNIITARNYGIADLTEKWLNEQEIPYDNIFFNGEKKHQVCNWKNINFMVEDNPDYVRGLADSGIEVALYPRPYNKDFYYKNTKKVNNWGEIYKMVFNKMLNDFQN